MLHRETDFCRLLRAPIVASERLLAVSPAEQFTRSGQQVSQDLDAESASFGQSLQMSANLFGESGGVTGGFGVVHPLPFLKTKSNLSSSRGFRIWIGLEQPGRSEEGTVPPIGAADTQVVLMAVGSLAEVAAQILAAGRDGGTPAALVQDATTHRQRVLRATLATIASRAAAVGITAPAVLIVGEVAALDLRWQPDATPHSDLKESAPNEQ